MFNNIIEFKVGSHGWLTDGRHYSVNEINRLSFDTEGNFKRCTITLEIEKELHTMEISEFVEIVDTVENDVITR